MFLRNCVFREFVMVSGSTTKPNGAVTMARRCETATVHFFFCFWKQNIVSKLPKSSNISKEPKVELFCAEV